MYVRATLLRDSLLILFYSMYHPSHAYNKHFPHPLLLVQDDPTWHPLS